MNRFLILPAIYVMCNGEVVAKKINSSDGIKIIKDAGRCHPGGG